MCLSALPLKGGALFFYCMNLLQYKDYKVTISDEAWLVPSIRKLFEKDKSKNKETFFNQMTYLYFYADVRSDYNYIDDEYEKSSAIIINEGLPDDFVVTPELNAAISDYIRLTTTTSSALLRDSMVAADRLRKFLVSVDYNERDDKGRPVYAINTVTSALKSIPEIAKSIKETERIVNQEMLEAGRARGGNEHKKLFEDGAV